MVSSFATEPSPSIKVDLNGREEFTWMDVKRHGEVVERDDRGVAASTLKIADVALRETGVGGKGFLRQPPN